MKVLGVLLPLLLFWGDAHSEEDIALEAARNFLRSLRGSRGMPEIGETDAADTDVTAPIVTLPKLGKVNGSVTFSTVQNRPIYQYFGVPFGQPPIGNLRFKAPAPAQPWTGIYDGTKPGKDCIQANLDIFGSLTRSTRAARSTASQEDTQSEDCLTLNVFTPNVNSSAKLPVLVFVFGGGFIFGTPRKLTPNNLLDKDIILVAPHYRLGPLGFLNLQEEGAPGNAGILDIVEALRWVNENIEQFGGDPGRVTLAGQSAGAAITSILHLSHLTEGLIHAALPMSGTAVDFWAWDRNPKESSTKIANFAGCANPETRIACLQSADSAKLQSAFILVAGLTISQGVGVGLSGASPSVQTAGTIVLRDLPENILRDQTFTPVPLFTGVTKHEGTLALSLITTGFLKPHNYQNQPEFLRYDLIPTLLKILNVDDPAGFVSDSAKGYFLNPTTLGDFSAMQDGLIDLSGAFAFKSGMRKYALLTAEAGKPVYVYTFVYFGPGTHSSMGIEHGSDQIYLFPSASESLSTSSDKQMENIMVDLCTNFVIYHNPSPPGVTLPNGVPTWETFAPDHEKYMALDVPCELRTNFTQELTVTRRDHFEENLPPSWKTTDF